jgi:23S rRNA pseudouridine1911/1915/1917 synthase
VTPQYRIDVPPTARGKRLDAFLTAAAADLRDAPCAGFSRARFQQLIESTQVTLNGTPCRAAHKLRGGEHIDVNCPPPVPMDITPVAMPLDVLYEDADLIIINKAQGLVVHPGAGVHGPTLVHGLVAHCGDLSGIGGVQRPGIVHRLDRGTSGCIVVAKNDHAHESLASQFACRTVVKRYRALVLGAPTPARATLQTLYGRHPTHRQRFTSKVTSGKTAVTSYSVMGAHEGLALLDVLLGTGRTHQIRVHLSEAGHPVLGDPLYGGRNFMRIANPDWRAEAEVLVDQALHAASLQIDHPRHGRPVYVEAPLPTVWSQLATRLVPS